jgi:Na+/proline symporter
MLLEFMLIFQAFTLLVTAAAYQKRDEILWAVAGILAGFMAVNAYKIQSYASKVVYVDGMVSMFNIAVLAFCIIFMFIDLSANYGAPIKEKLFKLLSKKKKVQPHAERRSAS